MIEVLWAVIGFVLVLGVLVTVHEFGHFWVARRCGVKVERFSIGFGRPLVAWRGRRDDTEYVIAAIPLGGYVKMLDDEPADTVAVARSGAFNSQPLWRRSAIVLAGPVANLLLAGVVYWLMFMVGLPGMRPYIGDVAPGSAAARAGIESQDLMVRIGDRTTRTWEEASLALLRELVSGPVIDMELEDAHGSSRRVQLQAQGVSADSPDLLQDLGITPLRPVLDAVIGELSPGLPAEQAGLQPGDRILAVNETPIADWGDWVAMIRSRPGQPMVVVILRGGNERSLSLTPQEKEVDGGSIGFIGAAPMLDSDAQDRYWTITRYGPGEALVRAWRKSSDVVSLTLALLGKMVTGGASVESIGGPLAIAEFAGASVQAGFSQFLSFLGFVSISLGILNLLPIPVLDGGHLLYYAVEAVKGSPLSARFRSIGQQGGLVLLLALMMLALYNDIVRLIH